MFQSKIIWIFFQTTFVFGQPQYQRTIIIQSARPCPNNNNYPSKLIFVEAHNENNLIIIKGHAELNETVSGPLKLTMHLEKCTLERTECRQARPIVLPDVCFFVNTEFFGVNSLAKITPRLGCPVKAVSLKFEV